MTLTELIALAAKTGFMFDERAFRRGDGYCFVGVLDDGYSSQRLLFDTIAQAARYFRREA